MLPHVLLRYHGQAALAHAFVRVSQHRDKIGVSVEGVTTASSKFLTSFSKESACRFPTPWIHERLTGTFAGLPLSSQGEMRIDNVG